MGSKQLLERALKIRGEYQEAWYFSGNLKILDGIIQALIQLNAEEENTPIPRELRVRMNIAHCYDGIARIYEPAHEVMKKLDVCCCIGYDFNENSFVFTNIKELT